MLTTEQVGLFIWNCDNECDGGLFRLFLFFHFVFSFSANEIFTKQPIQFKCDMFYHLLTNKLNWKLVIRKSRIQLIMNLSVQPYYVQKGAECSKEKNQNVRSRTALQLNCLFMHGCFGQMSFLSLQTGNNLRQGQKTQNYYKQGQFVKCNYRRLTNKGKDKINESE